VKLSAEGFQSWLWNVGLTSR